MSPPEITRFERPTSMVTDSWLSRTRVTLQSQAIRWTELEEMGKENSKVGEPDLARPQGSDALAQLGLVFAHAQRVPGRMGVHVAVETHPVGRVVEAFLVPLLALVKLRRVAGEVELQAVDEVTQAGEQEALVDHLGSNLEHAQSLSN